VQPWQPVEELLVWLICRVWWVDALVPAERNGPDTVATWVTMAAETAMSLEMAILLVMVPMAALMLVQLAPLPKRFAVVLLSELQFGLLVVVMGSSHHWLSASGSLWPRVVAPGSNGFNGCNFCELPFLA
jgi:hypothetical protein